MQLYLESLDRWIRVDARGNKKGVNAPIQSWMFFNRSTPADRADTLVFSILRLISACSAGCYSYVQRTEADKTSYSIGAYTENKPWVADNPRFCFSERKLL